MLKLLKSTLAKSLRQAQRFVERPIQLQSGHVTLGPAQRAEIERARELDAERARWYRMTDELDAMLDHNQPSRAQARHLHLVEAALRHGGIEDVQAMPLRVVVRALAELEALVVDWSPAGLAEFRSRLAVLIKDRAGELKRKEDDLDARALAEVSEATGVDPSLFEDMERSWAGKMPAPAAGAMAASRR